MHGQSALHSERRCQRPPDVWRGVYYALGMLAAISSGSAFVIGGLLAHATGFTAILLAGSVPAAGLAWAITISVMQRGARQATPSRASGARQATPNRTSGARQAPSSRARHSGDGEAR